MTAINTPMKLADWLDDICVRFIINLPQEELVSVERIIFQIEEGHWYYEDFIRPLDPSLPSIGLRQFCSLIFSHCPLLAQFSDFHAAAYDEFLAYKVRVPVRGGIMLNTEMNQVVLVKGWKKSARWSFPRGKINKDELDLDCAVREVYEETGFEVREAGLIPDERHVKYLDITLREQQMRLYVFRNVPMDTYFEPRTRKEISKIQWYKITELPGGRNKAGMGIAEDSPKNIFYMVAPFMNPLKQWIKQQRKQDRLAAGLHAQEAAAMEDTDAEAGLADAPELANAESMHLQSLLSRMTQNSKLSLGNVPENEPMAASTEKLASELKKLLSVGGTEGNRSAPAHSDALAATTPQHAKPASDQQSGLLLSLLRGSNPPASESIAIPVTPLENMETSPPQSLQPHHHNHPPPLGGLPPQFQYPLGTQHLRPPQHSGLPHPRGPVHHQHQIFIQQHGGSMPQPFQNQQRMLAQPGPYQNPFSSQDGIYPVSGHPVPSNRDSPAATGSDLPLPPMSSGYLGNGNGSHFEQQQAPQVIHPQLPQHPHPPHPPHPHPQHPPPQHYPTFSQELPSESEKQMLHNQSIQQRIPQPPNGNRAPSVGQRTAQQNTLLGLFHNTGQAAVTDSAIAPVAELSASTPHGTLHGQAALPSPVGPPPGYQKEQTLQFATRRLTSATVSGPLNEPDFDTIRRNKPPVELGNGREMGQSPVPVHTVGSSTVLEAPRPFQPSSILQRQQQFTPSNMAVTPAPPPQPPVHAAAANMVNLFDRRGQQPEVQKTNLLSLFNGPSGSQNHATTGVAPAPETLQASKGLDSQKSSLLSLFHASPPNAAQRIISHGQHSADAATTAAFPSHPGMIPVPADHQRRLSQNDSPVSPLPDRRVPYKVQTSAAAAGVAVAAVAGQTTPQASALSAATPQQPLFDAGQGAVVPRSRVSSVTSAGAGSGTGRQQTPIAEEHKQFLFKYLEDAIRGGK